MKKITTHAALVLFLISIAGIQVTNVFYFHAHKLADGTVVCHAHPFQKSQDQAPYKSHNHTSREFFYLNHIQVVINTIGLLVLVLYLVPFLQQVPLFEEKRLLDCFNQFPLPRPPPCFQ